MTTSNADETLARPGQAALERAYVEEYLRAHGTSLDQLTHLPGEQARALMREASLYASLRLTEVEARSHLVEELHGGPTPM
ncbi:MAG TPA: hypothetical protein PKD53_08415 [Chloroflexaceae bacterium]|nr:hypothetical protein [Chloroflexaceae bacterium]